MTHLASSGRRRAPRLAGDARRAQIIGAACTFFADNGFGGPTRDLAASIGVTQALLYRYFDSKTDLIEAVFAEVFRDHWSDGATDIFAASAGRPMVDRLTDLYEAMLAKVSGVSTRLFFRAGLDSYPDPITRSAERSWPLWLALLAQWRREEGLPELDELPMMEGERAMVLSFHNAMTMVRVREHVFHAQRVMSDGEEARQIAEIYDVGARTLLRALHGGSIDGPRVKPAGPVAAAAA
ncbi:TetR/AcrR family transcriptional regulator [Methylopila henanensis]|uniref:TetR/AcrR family transcriptional regulator n=1 Tax=Methylopila henanensis TaxID=873516 RepID=A0ABW4KCY8_9HYPH